MASEIEANDHNAESRSAPVQPGWYPNPDGSGGERWWDGFEWSKEFVRAPARREMPEPVLDKDFAETFLTYGASQRRIAADTDRSDTRNAIGIVFVVFGGVIVFFALRSETTGVVLESRVTEMVIGAAMLMNGLRVIARGVYR